jgi:putative membrane protein (TIGR04086 family)
MKVRLSQVHWGLVLKAGVVLNILIFVLGLGLSFLFLALINWGHVDSHSAIQAITMISPFLVLVMTGYGAMRVARQVESAAPLHGFFVGLAVALISLLLALILSEEMNLARLGLTAALVAAGWLGGILGSRR